MRNYLHSRSIIMKLVLLLALIATILLPHCDGRPSDHQESKGSDILKFLKGCYVGVETVLSLFGYYDYDINAEEVYNEAFSEEEGDDEEEMDDDEWKPTSMKLVCLGLGRTGTTSLALGIETLGYTVIHDDEHVEMSELYELLEDKEIDFDEFHAMAGEMGFNATFKTDWEWAKRHPETKVILTVRDTPEKYANSWLSAVGFIDLLDRIPYRYLKHTNDLYQSFYFEYKMETTGNRPELYKDKETLMTVYEEYIETVKANIPNDRLLIFNVKQGWDPLCQFLNIDQCPSEDGTPFPHVHDRVKLQGETFVIASVTYVWPLFILLPLALPYYLFLIIVQRCKKVSYVQIRKTDPNVVKESSLSKCTPNSDRIVKTRKNKGVSK